MKCTCGHEKKAHHRGVSTCINGGRCLCATYTPVDPNAEAETAWREWLGTTPFSTAMYESGREAFIAGWEARSC